MMMGWGVFWIILLIALIYFLFQQQQRREAPPARSVEDPLEVLQRRYAAGEISTEEYEERRRVLERDRQGF